MTHSFPTRRSSDLPSRARHRQRRLQRHVAAGPRAAPDQPGRRLPRVPDAGDLRRPDAAAERADPDPGQARSEEPTSELQSLMRISYAVFCLKKKKTNKQSINTKHVHTSHYT